MNVDGASGLGGSKEDGPGLFAEAADKEGLCFPGSVLEERGSESDVFLKGIPVLEQVTEGCVGEVGGKAIKKDSEYVCGGAATATKKIRGDT